MTDPHPLGFLRLSFALLSALDSRHFHYWVQPVHYLVRALHILSMGAFFGGVSVLDLRLLGRGRMVPFKPVAEHLLPFLYWSFGVCFVSGLVLFFYDPVHVGSHAYFVPKLLLIGTGLAVIATYRRTRFRFAFGEVAAMPRSARAAAIASLVIWTGVVVCSCLNTEAAPKVYLQPY